jgi:hypothetical protein
MGGDKCRMNQGNVNSSVERDDDDSDDDDDNDGD